MNIQKIIQAYKIKQVYYSHKNILKLNLPLYKNKNENTIFIGISKNDQRDLLKEYKKITVIIWLKTDFDNKKNIKFLRKIQNKNNIINFLYNSKSINPLDIYSLLYKNIVYVNLIGGFGNQLFMIFNAISLAKDYNKKFNFTYDKNYINDYYKSKKVLRKSSDQYSLFKNLKFKEISKKIVKKFKVINEVRHQYNKIILDKDSSYFLKGYFQCYKYFWHNIDEIKKHLFIDTNKINEIKNKFNKPILALHLRLTDYVGREILHSIPNLYYYKKALSYYNLNNYQIILFSDDIKLAKEKIKTLDINVIYADNIYKNDEDQFYMLCLSDVRICANSTFSLMSCYLNEIYNFKENCEYIFPHRFFGPKVKNHNMKDYMPNNKFFIINYEKENEERYILNTNIS